MESFWREKVWLTVTSWHVSIKERISPQIEVVGVPIFLCPPTQRRAANAGGKGNTLKKIKNKKKIERKKEPRSFTPPGHRSGAMPAPFSHFSSLWRNPTAAPLRPTPGGTSSTGNADPFFTRSLFSLKKNRRRERERERLQTCSFFSFFFFLCPSPVRTETWDLVCG